MRAYAATGDKKKALSEAELALAQAPDDPNKKNLQGMIQKLEGEPTSTRRRPTRTVVDSAT
jgi:hypothetical protein